MTERQTCVGTNVAFVPGCCSRARRMFWKILTSRACRRRIPQWKFAFIVEVAKRRRPWTSRSCVLSMSSEPACTEVTIRYLCGSCFVVSITRIRSVCITNPLHVRAWKSDTSVYSTFARLHDFAESVTEHWQASRKSSTPSASWAK